jgi:hypothetical protein
MKSVIVIRTPFVLKHIAVLGLFMHRASVSSRVNIKFRACLTFSRIGRHAVCETEYFLSAMEVNSRHY